SLEKRAFRAYTVDGRPPMTRSRGAALFVCLALIPASGRAFDAAALRASILDKNDPKAAAAFLADPAGQQALAAADPASTGPVFERAAELADLSRLLQASVNPRAIRLGLSKRPRCAFCQKPSELERWAADRLDLDEAHAHALAEASADWD